MSTHIHDPVAGLLYLKAYFDKQDQESGEKKGEIQEDILNWIDRIRKLEQKERQLNRLLGKEIYPISEED